MDKEFSIRGAKPRGLGTVLQKLKQQVKLVYNFERFPVQKLGFHKYRSRAWTVFLYKHTITKI